MLLGIDLGTQSMKAIVVDESFELLGRGGEALEVHHPAPGWAEQDVAAWLASLRPAITQALDEAGAQASDLRAVGVTGQLDGLVAIRPDDGAAKRALIWMDRRATAEAAAICPDRVREVCGQVADAGHMAPKIRWMLDHVACPPGTRWHQPVSFLIERLTGESVMDHALASTTMLYDLRAGGWDEGLCDAFGIDLASLPRIAPAESVAGTVSRAGAALSGLQEGTPVVVGTGDDFTSAIGAGVTAPGTVVVSLGTAEIIGAVHHTPVIDRDGMVETHAFPGGMSFVENPGWLSGGAVRWIRELLDARDWAALDAMAAHVRPGSDGVTMLPTLAGAMAPEWLAHARGAVYGLTPAHGAGHLVRALLEGTACGMADVVDRLTALGVATDRIRLVGGGARSALWAQIRASLADRPVDIVEVDDAAALGAIACAAPAGGLAASIAEAAGRLARVARTVEPDPRDRAAYDGARERAHALFAALRPVMQRSWAS